VTFKRSFAHAQALVQLPCLEDVYVSGGMVVDLTSPQALDGGHAKIEGLSVVIDVWSAGLHPYRPRNTFTGTREVRIDATYIRMCNFICAGENSLDLEAFFELLCPPCLETMEIISGCHFPRLRHHPGQNEIPNAWRLVMGKMMAAYGSKFAFQVEDGVPKRTAWRRWPTPGTREHDAACRLHKDAKIWAAA